MNCPSCGSHVSAVACRTVLECDGCGLRAHSRAEFERVALEEAVAAPSVAPTFVERHPTLATTLFLLAVLVCLALAGGQDAAHP